MVTTITATTMFHLLGYTIASRPTPCAEQNPECQTDFSHLGCAQHFRRAPWVTQTPPCTTRLSQFCCEHLRFTRLRRFGWLMCGGGGTEVMAGARDLVGTFFSHMELIGNKDPVAVGRGRREQMRHIRLLDEKKHARWIKSNKHREKGTNREQLMRRDIPLAFIRTLR